MRADDDERRREAWDDARAGTAYCSEPACRPGGSVASGSRDKLVLLVRGWVTLLIAFWAGNSSVRISAAVRRPCCNDDRVFVQSLKTTSHGNATNGVWCPFSGHFAGSDDRCPDPSNATGRCASGRAGQVVSRKRRTSTLCATDAAPHAGTARSIRPRSVPMNPTLPPGASPQRGAQPVPSHIPYYVGPRPTPPCAPRFSRRGHLLVATLSGGAVLAAAAAVLVAQPWSVDRATAGPFVLRPRRGGGRVVRRRRAALQRRRRHPGRRRSPLRVHECDDRLRGQGVRRRRARAPGRVGGRQRASSLTGLSRCAA